MKPVPSALLLSALLVLSRRPAAVGACSCAPAHPQQLICDSALEMPKRSRVQINIYYSFREQFYSFGEEWHFRKMMEALQLELGSIFSLLNLLRSLRSGIVKMCQMIY
ncbi:hypothetical protein llap_21307 [Limosa lapponica baueri]|uniref:Uncharacterized protein n=1 Tax=Limosa lapponica baueri TaxID=1758121 RepID=A0A2I0T3L1_LIMLA|nr:hypothetical protein llap_21307 [Limosa lapponica baueri]